MGCEDSTAVIQTRKLIRTFCEYMDQTIMIPNRNCILLILAFMLPAYSQAEPEYTRSQCIVKMILEWENRIDLLDREEIIGSISIVFGNTFLEIYQSTPPSMTYQGDDREYIYIQYKSMCDQKYPTTRNILSRIESEFQNYVNFFVSDETIQPSPDTIDIYGEYWIDGDSRYEFTNKAIRIYFSKQPE